MNIQAFTLSLALALPVLAFAADEPVPKAPNEQVIVPQVDRRAVKPTSIPSNDFELGLLAGTYATQNFGTSTVTGFRLGYHITEDFFVEGVYGMAKVSDEAYRRIYPVGIFDKPEEDLTYYNLSIGWNVFPGEIFIGKNRAWTSAFYVIAGAGSTKFAEQRCQTFNFGFGARVFPTDWMALQLDVRDHMFKVNILNSSENTQNIEMTLGLTFFF